MYTEFYGLKEKPFNLTPSPRFVYMSEGHKEAMALLTYGVTERKGFILLTGEVGTGKTTMIHNLIDNLDTGVEYVYLVNPLLSPQEFIDYLAFSSFKKRVHFRSKADFLLEFEDFLQTCFHHQKIFILIIDEAHKLSYDLLEEIRLLSNMEYAEEKLINIFLVGQPELNENLNSPRGRATLQRIGIRYDIPPLSLKETGEYIETRLTVAGAPRKEGIFQKDAIEAIYRFSQGYPRTINILADNSMLLGYSRDKKTITATMIEESYNAMKLEGSFLKDSAVKPPEIAASTQDTRSGGAFKWIFASLIIILAALLVFMVATSRISIPYISDLFNRDSVQDTVHEDSVVIKGQTGTDNRDKEGRFQGAEGNQNNINGDTRDQGLIHEGTPSDEMSEYDARSLGGAKEDRPVTEGGRQSVILTDLEIFVFNRDTGFSKSFNAKEGDTLTSLAEKVYGHAGEEELDLLKRYNPEILNIDKIAIGQRIYFPVYTVLVAAYESFEKADGLCRQMKNEGYDAAIISPGDDDEATSFKVTVGAFNNKKDAEDFAFNNLEGRSYNIPR